jgi:hypothetical protein
MKDLRKYSIDVLEINVSLNAGDLYDEEAILNWLLTQKNPGGDVIEDLEGQRLKKLIE